MRYKVFDANTTEYQDIQAAINALLDKGLTLADGALIEDLMRTGKIPRQSYDTGVARLSDGSVRSALPNELRDILGFYRNGCRLLNSDSSLFFRGRFVGVDQDL